MAHWQQYAYNLVGGLTSKLRVKNLREIIMACLYIGFFYALRKIGIFLDSKLGYIVIRPIFKQLRVTPIYQILSVK